MVDLEVLRGQIKVITPRQKLFKALKEELLALGYWQNKPRGNPKQGFKGMQARIQGRLSTG